MGGNARIGRGEERGQFGEWNIIGASFHARGLDGSWKTSSGGLRRSPSLSPLLPLPLHRWHSLPLHPGNAVSIEPEHPGVRLYRFLHFMIYHAAFSPARAQSARARELRWPESAQIDKRNNGGCEIGGTRSDIARRYAVRTFDAADEERRRDERTPRYPANFVSGGRRLDLRCR